MAKPNAKAAVPELMTAREFFKRERPNSSLGDLSRETGVPRTTLVWHLEAGKPIRASTARKLETWSGGRISAAKMLEKGEIS